MPITLLASAALALTAGSASASVQVPMFERAEFGEGVSLVTYGVVTDTRCPEPRLCLQDERLIVVTIITVRGKGKEHAVELGVPLRVADGWLTLVSTTARPQLNGVVRLSEYDLTYVFEPLDQQAEDAA